MEYFRIAVSIIGFICTVTLVFMAYKMDKESEEIFNSFQQTHNLIADQEGYQSFDEKLKIDLLKIENRITVHDGHINQNFSMLFILAIVYFVSLIYLTFKENVKRDRK